MPEPRIVAMGSVPDDTLLDYVLGLASGTRLLYVPTASMENPARTSVTDSFGPELLETRLLR
jgi:hypothetical protein